MRDDGAWAYGPLLLPKRPEASAPSYLTPTLASHLWCLMPAKGLRRLRHSPPVRIVSINEIIRAAEGSIGTFYREGPLYVATCLSGVWCLSSFLSISLQWFCISRDRTERSTVFQSYKRYSTFLKFYKKKERFSTVKDQHTIVITYTEYTTLQRH